MPIHDWTRVLPGIFHDFHATWIVEIEKSLNEGLLPPDYYALAEQIAGRIGPDVLALSHRDGFDGGPNEHPTGCLALATAPPRVQFTAQTEDDSYLRKRKTVVIRHRSGDRVVALIEVLSPGNKKSRRDLRAFVEKAAAALRQGIHLLLIDLFPPSRRDPQGIHGEVWAEFVGEHDFRLPEDRRLTLAAYAAGEIQQAFIQPAAVGDPLPDMPLFLTSEDYLPVPLERTYTEAVAAVPRRWREELALPRDAGPSPS